MRKSSVVFILSVLLVGWNISSAWAGIYASGNLIGVKLEDADTSSRYPDVDNNELSFENGFGFAAALGYAAENGLRVEGEIGGRYTEIDDFKKNTALVIDDGYISTLSLMANTYYNFMPDQPVSPFVGAGVGVAGILLDFDYDDYDYDDYDDYDEDDGDYDTVLAYQLSAGVSFAITEKLRADVQYRYFATEDPDFDDIEIEYATHNALVGLRYLF